MAEEQYVNRDQHRADLAELRGALKEELAGLRHDMVTMRGELKEEIAGVRQDVAVLTKAIEYLTQTVASGFTDMRQAMSDHSLRLDRQEASLRQEIRDVRTTSQRQLWVLIGVVIVTMVGGMIKTVFFP
jgi:ribosomal protein L29